MFQCFVLCCWATKFYLPVYLVRMDERTGNIVLLAGEDILIAIESSGEWEFD
ncbi:MAG: hypothetical protein WA902_17390 [Thermosynechococcaceae cyanobacterium]